MKIIHRIGINADAKQKEIIHRLGIDISFQSGLTAFDLDENSSAYQALKPYIQEWNVFDSASAVFTNDEINNSRLLVFKDCWSNGYPMPDGSGQYKSQTYDDTNYCTSCGIGLVQKEPFRLKKEPNWGSRHMFMLNWIYDEIFVKKDLYDQVFKGKGIEMIPVLLYKKEKTITDTVQLVIPTVNDSINLDTFEFQICEVCNRKRYNLILRDMIPPFKAEAPDKPFFKSKEYFGTGANARKYIFLNKDILKSLSKFNVKVNLIPCRL